MSKKLLLVILPLAIVAFAANDVHWLSDPDAPRIPAAPGAGGGYKLPTPPAGDQPPFGTVVNRWSLTMSGGYAGSGITWQRDSGKFFLMDQGATGSFRVWKLDPSDPTGTITQVAWQFKDLGSGKKFEMKELMTMQLEVQQLSQQMSMTTKLIGKAIENINKAINTQV